MEAISQGHGGNYDAPALMIRMVKSKPICFELFTGDEHRQHSAMTTIQGTNLCHLSIFMVNQSTANCTSGGEYFYTGWQSGFNTGPTAITLADLSATGAMASSLPLAATAGASALAALSAGFVAWRRRK